MGKHYSESFRKQAIEKFLNRRNKNASDIAKELGVSTFSLYQWTKGKAVGKKSNKSHLKSGDRFETLLSFCTTPESKQGEFLRSQGLTSEQMDAWREELKKQLDTKSDRSESVQATQRIEALEKSIRRKDKVLAETTALLVLSKKAEALWGITSDEE